MPKVEKNVGDDPDPAEWLFISLEQKRIDQSKPYDAKKACWVPDEKLGYILGEIKSTKGDLVSVTITGGEVISIKWTPSNDVLESPSVQHFIGIASMSLMEHHFTLNNSSKFYYIETTGIFLRRFI